MLSLLLVDDEPLELKALKDHIDWEGMGIFQVLTAGNGRIAYEMVLEYAPDIVITDVHMPGVNGIELARKIHELNRKIKVIFLSGYDEFSYVKSAMQMGAMDYLLKPFTEKEIGKVILKAKEEMDRDRLYLHSLEALEQQLLKKICEEGEDSNILAELASIRDVSVGVERYSILMFWGITTQVLVEYLIKNMNGIQALWLENGCMTIIFHSYVDPRERGERIQQLLEKLSGFLYNGIYFERRCIKASELHSCFTAMKTWETYVYYQKAGFFEGIKSEILWEDIQRKNISEFIEEKMNRLWKLFPYENPDEVEKEIDLLFGELMNLHLSRNEIEGHISRVCMLLEHRLNPSYHGIQKQIFAKCKTEGYRCIGDMKELVMNYFAQMYIRNREVEKDKDKTSYVVKRVQEYVQRHYGEAMTMEEMAEEIHLSVNYVRSIFIEKDKDKTSYVVKRVQEYVQRHYGEAMTMEEMAEEIHLSVNYVRSIFKEGTGQTILEYITDYRFERACELLQDSSLKVKEIGSSVGYENISYFGAVFTKRYGMTPNEWRKRKI